MLAVRDALPALARLVGMRSLHLALSFAGKRTALSPVPPPWQPQPGTGLVSNPLSLSLCRGKDSLCTGEVGPPVWGEGGGEREAAGGQRWLPGFAGSPKKQLQGQRVLVAQTSPRGALWAPHQCLGDTHPQSRLCCSSWKLNRSVPHVGQELLGVPPPAGAAPPAHRCDPAHTPCCVLESNQREDHASQPQCKCPVLPAVSRCAGAGHCFPRDTPDPGVRGNRVRPCAFQLQPSTAQAQKRTSWARAMAQTTFFLAVASRQGLSCGKIGLTSEQANLTSGCLQPSNAAL